MTVEQGLAFVAFALVAAVTPGPSNVMIAAAGAALGVVRGLPCACGAAFGMAALLFAAALGLGGLVLAAPLLLRAMNAAGAAFLLYLAWKLACAGPAGEAPPPRAMGFAGAALFQAVNPKAWLVATGAVGAHLPTSGEAPWLAAALLAGLFFAAALPCGLVWLGLGAVLQRALRRPRAARLFNLIMAGALVASVFLILL